MLLRHDSDGNTVSFSPAMGAAPPLNVAFIGLGAMGFGMATHLVKTGYNVTGYDVYEPCMAKFKDAGGSTAASPLEAAKRADFLICMVANSKQADSVLFDAKDGAVQALPPNATLVMCSTVPSAYLKEIQARLELNERNNIFLIDSPVSGGTVRAANGTLTIMTSGNEIALKRGNPLLSALSEKLYTIPGGVGAASNVKMVNQLLAGIHIAAAAEAMGLAAKMALNTRQVYEVIVNAAGNSWMFENRVPHMLENDWTPRSALDIFVKDMGIVTSAARAQEFPLPLSSVAEQQYISATSQGYGREDDAGLVRLYTPQSPRAVHEQASEIMKGYPSRPVPAKDIQKIGFIGLGAMGKGMAESLVKAGFHVCGYDVYAPSIKKFMAGAAGGNATAAKSAGEAASGAQVLILMVQNASQAEDALFGSGKAAEALPEGSIVILSSTVPPFFARNLRQRLVETKNGIDLVDAPVSGGVARAAQGQLTIISSADEAAISIANPVLCAMSGSPKNLYYINGGAGAASSVKLINQLLAGVHIAAAAEAMAFGAKLGLETRSLYDMIKNAAGGSWMFENRVPAMLDADWTPHSMLAIFVKDLGIVLEESRRLLYPVPLSSAVYNIYLQGAAQGWSREADGGIVRLWESFSGVSVAKCAAPRPEIFRPREYSIVNLKDTIKALPPPYEGDALSMVNEQIANPKTPILVVLDDDPTGTQTCHNIAVLTVWDHDTLCRELCITEKGFFILTNSRALPPVEARKLLTKICQNVEKAAQHTGKSFEVVLRGDSTLRGHFPDEPEVIEEVLGKTDAWILAPFFFQGGRYTIDDVHYVAEGDSLVPASQTPFAQDATFGYKSSNLSDYVLEKTGSKFSKDKIISITIEDIRIGGPSKVATKLLSAAKGSVVIVNAAAESDMIVFAAGVLTASQQGRKYLYRTGAAFVSSRLGIKGIPPLTAHDLNLDNSPNTHGGLIVAGSYVPKTTAQLASLCSRRGSKLHVIELDVSAMINSTAEAEAAVLSAIETASSQIASGHDVLVMTSRKIITGGDAISSLKIGSVVAAALVKVVRNIEVRPRYIIAKGGITSSDAATKGLEIKRAMIRGQAAPGVPLWRCDDETSRHVGVPYVVFPGNVGGEDTLAELVERWAHPGESHR